MKICVIGWYGTETIGDRAILAGLISVFKDVYTDFELELGSLQPFFSERTVNEDYAFYKCITGREIPIKIFDTKRPDELKAAIKRCDMLVMEGRYRCSGSYVLGERFANHQWCFWPEDTPRARRTVVR